MIILRAEGMVALTGPEPRFWLAVLTTPIPTIRNDDPGLSVSKIENVVAEAGTLGISDFGRNDVIRTPSEFSEATAIPTTLKPDDLVSVVNCSVETVRVMTLPLGSRPIEIP